MTPLFYSVLCSSRAVKDPAVKFVNTRETADDNNLPSLPVINEKIHIAVQNITKTEAGRYQCYLAVNEQKGEAYLMVLNFPPSPKETNIVVIIALAAMLIIIALFLISYYVIYLKADVYQNTAME